MGVIRILFVSDTHLGFDYPFRPRIKRRRRGPDFFANFDRALEPANNGEVDCVVHGGDILYRSKVPAKLIEMAFEPLKQVADKGVPVFLVPGNHERSIIPYRILAAYKNIHIFDRPQTFVFEKEGFRLGLAGFPYERNSIRKNFIRTVEQTGWKEANADGYVLCIHHCVEGATVGPGNYVFRYKEDVIKTSDIPNGFAAVLSGHIHRFQVLTSSLTGRPIAAPVLYPGSVERTSFAEKDEVKGYLTIDVSTAGQNKGKMNNWKFHKLPARPMVQTDKNAENMYAGDLRNWIKDFTGKIPDDSIVKIRILGKIPEDTMPVISAESLRLLIPPTMNITVTPVEYVRPRK